MELTCSVFSRGARKAHGAHFARKSGGRASHPRAPRAVPVRHEVVPGICVTRQKRQLAGFARRTSACTAAVRHVRAPANATPLRCPPLGWCAAFCAPRPRGSRQLQVGSTFRGVGILRSAAQAPARCRPSGRLDGDGVLAAAAGSSARTARSGPIGRAAPAPMPNAARAPQRRRLAAALDALAGKGRGRELAPDRATALPLESHPPQREGPR